MQSFDYLVVGSGAGGSSAAYGLAQRGKTVLVVERGAALPSDGSTLDIENVIRRGAFKTSDRWLDGNGRPMKHQEYANLGGKTKWYGAALMRLRADEFQADSERQFLDWPIALDDLAPFYNDAERLLRPRLFPVEPDLQAFLTAVRQMDPGWIVRPLPLGLSKDIDHHASNLKFYDGFALSSPLKADAETVFLQAIRNRPNVKILTGAEVIALEPDQAVKRVHCVVCADGRRFFARYFILAAGAMNSPRLLQRFMRRYHLWDRFGGADLIGRYFKCHISSLVLVVRPDPVTDLVRKTAWLSHSHFPHSSVQPIGWLDGQRIGARLPRYLPDWLLRAIGSRAYGFLVMTEDGSHRDNRVTDGDGSEPRLDYNYNRLRSSLVEHHRVRRALKSLIHRQCALALTKPMSRHGTDHACGTLVMGHDARTSVTDAWGRVHGFDNLFVADGSPLPRSGCVNPALTIFAWGLRVAAAAER